ncbi:hypothetical protein Nos7524_5486 [Nostoc sp. PCC 7524]|uniref:hypothetical protein n=1 Tax=Nostoc sp. (strain ATCC 29411 / PCC 7524) TaxID=28072 RepID=UPI00029EFE11|nr:hypothetical protein [Nostoc sp. PCC 7524]AFY51200.1 hypothetical protein Nos7524_5486 [Nostoc sp. PCC 7524]
MNDIRLYSRVAKSLIPGRKKNQLDVLLEWCRIVYGCLEGGQIEDAKIFLEQAITEAEKPIQD